MSIHSSDPHLPEPSPEQPFADESALNQSIFRLETLDQLITSGKTIYYNSGDFHDDRVVGKFIEDHRFLRTAMLGTLVPLYADPCTCCIPAYGPRDFQFRLTEADAAVDYLQKSITRGEVLDLLFVSERIYREAYLQINELSPETKLIVACDRYSNSEASELRKSGVAAIDVQDYLRCSPLNAVIALTVFGKLMATEAV